MYNACNFIWEKEVPPIGTILVVEDDRTIASGLEYSLQQEQYAVTLCHDAAAAKQFIVSRLDEIDLCLFDISLPDGSGYDLCRLVKACNEEIPVIFLTAVDEEVNVVMGLDMGADDYITKPFRIRELISRIKSVMRRYQKQAQPKAAVDLGHLPQRGGVARPDAPRAGQSDPHASLPGGGWVSPECAGAFHCRQCLDRIPHAIEVSETRRRGFSKR
mgnify:CR=1 FL=1